MLNHCLSVGVTSLKWAFCSSVIKNGYTIRFYFTSEAKDAGHLMKAEVCEMGAVREGMCLDCILSYRSLESCGQKA